MGPQCAMLALLLLSSYASAVRADAPAGKPVIGLAGDSTVTDTSGWGKGFADTMGPLVTVENFAKSGRSSKSYRDEKHWDKVIAAKPDYVIIQFGHNDMPGKGPERETDPATTYRANMERYVDEAIQAGIKPILATSIARREFTADGKIRSTLAPYTDVVKKIAGDKHIPLLDLHKKTIELYERIGPEGCDKLSPVKDGKVDHTHLNAMGGEVIGALVVEELREAVPALANFVQIKPTTEPLKDALPRN